MPDRRRLLFAACFAPALFEIGARVATTIADDIAQANERERTDWLVFSPMLGWERKPGYKGVAGLAEREFDAAGYFTADTNEVAGGHNHKKVVFIGDSNTFGFGARTSDSFVKIVERRLPGVATINLAAMGYTSYQGNLVVAAQVPLLKPDLIVASFNVNDRRCAQYPGGQDSPRTFRRLYEESRHQRGAATQAVERLRVYRAMCHVLRRAGLMHTPDQELDVSQLVPRVGPGAYRENLRRIVATARAMQIPVMFLILRDSPLQVGPIRAGVESLRRGDLEASIAHLQQAVQGPQMFSALGRIYLSEALAAKGDKALATQVLKTRSHYDSFRGGQLVRLDTEYNDIMSAVARETLSELVDGAEVLEREPLDFIDNCHFNIDGHRRLGEHLAKRIAAVLGTPVHDAQHAHVAR
jgi:lysophospholipase L1-like esterase